MLLVGTYKVLEVIRHKDLTASVRVVNKAGTCIRVSAEEVLNYRVGARRLHEVCDIDECGSMLLPPSFVVLGHNELVTQIDIHE